jgi:hypothetical protein
MKLYMCRLDNGIVWLISLVLALAIMLSLGLSLSLATPVLAASDNMTVVSDTSTVVTNGNVSGASYPENAVLAWQPYDSTNNHWDNTITGHVFSTSAKWIWESYRVVHPVSGDIVDFKKSFSIPGNPTAGTLYITCDNGYELHVNGDLVDSAQLAGDWRMSNLTESFVYTYGWQTVESWNITSCLVPGANFFEIATANEYYGSLDGQGGGTINNNPAGLIFEADITFTPGDEPPPPEPPSPPTTAVGGAVYSVNKAQVLVPWLCLFLVLSLAVGGVAFSLRKRA